jgi:hypothetical protein
MSQTENYAKKIADWWHEREELERPPVEVEPVPPK